VLSQSVPQLLKCATKEHTALFTALNMLLLYIILTLGHDEIVYFTHHNYSFHNKLLCRGKDVHSTFEYPLNVIICSITPVI